MISRRFLIILFSVGVAAMFLVALATLILSARPRLQSKPILAFPTYDQVDDFAQALLESLGGEDDNRTLSLITGYSDLAEKLRAAALSDPHMLKRHDLTARHKLSVLALRDRFSRAEIMRLSPEALIQVHPDPTQSVLDLPDGTQVILNEVKRLNDRKGMIALYIGNQFHQFDLKKTKRGWQADLTQVFDAPTFVTPIDAALMRWVAARGGQESAWLAIYASLSGKSVDDGLLQTP